MKGNLSFVSDIALYYAQYKHIQIWMGIYLMTAGLKHFDFGFSSTFCLESVSV